jgi:hypothetical protein
MVRGRDLRYGRIVPAIRVETRSEAAAGALTHHNPLHHAPPWNAGTGHGGGVFAKALDAPQWLCNITK